MIRTVIADDQELVRSGFALILETEQDMQVVGEASDGRQAVAACRELRPDVVLMDVRMPVMDGIEASRQITESEQTHVLMLTTFDLDEYVYAAFKAGAGGFILKDARRDELLHAVRTVAAGDTLVAPAITRRLIEQCLTRPQAGQPSPRLDPLTNRELEILRLVGRGLSNTEIATTLVISESTVKTHVGRIFTKLNVHDRAQAVVLAYETGLVTPGED